MEADLDEEESLSKYDRHSGDQYQNHGQNFMLDTTIKVVEQQKQFSGTAAEEFAQAFKAQTGKIVEALKAKEERQNNLPPQLLAPLQEPRIRNFPSKNSGRRKMTDTEAAVVAEADSARAQRKTRKELEIKQKYEAKLAALREEFSSPLLSQSRSATPKSFSPTFSDSQVRMTNTNTPIHISSSDSEGSEDEPNQPSPKMITTNSTFRSSSAPHQSGRIKKPTRKVESQKRREAEQAAQEPEPKKRKMSKSKVPDLTSQLKELLGSDIEF